MDLSVSQLKRHARQAMAQTTPHPILLTLVYLLLTTGLYNLVDMLLGGSLDSALDIALSVTGDPGRSSLLLFLYIFLNLYLVVMNYGYHFWALDAVRGHGRGFSPLLDGFGMAGRVVLTQLAVMVKLTLWAMLLGVVFAPLFYFSPLPLMWVELAVLAVLVVLLVLRYSLTPYLLKDQPGLGPFQAVNLSVAMLRGHMWAYVRLQLSFLGWYLLDLVLNWAILASVLYPHISQLLYLLQSDPYSAMSFYASITGGLWVSLSTLLVSSLIYLLLLPYRATAQALFYEALRAAQARENALPLL